MSWLAGGQQQGPDPVQAAKVEMEMYTGKLRNRLCGAVSLRALYPLTIA